MTNKQRETIKNFGLVFKQSPELIQALKDSDNVTWRTDFEENMYMNKYTGAVTLEFANYMIFANEPTIISVIHFYNDGNNATTKHYDCIDGTLKLIGGF